MTIKSTFKPKKMHVATCNGKGCTKSLRTFTDRWDLARMVKKAEGWQWVNRGIQYCPGHAKKPNVKSAPVKSADKAKKTKTVKTASVKALTGIQKVLAQKLKAASDKPKRKSYYKPVALRVPIAPVVKEQEPIEKEAIQDNRYA